MYASAGILIAGVGITSCFLRILTPLIAMKFSSMLFVSINLAIHFLIVFGCSFFVYTFMNSHVNEYSPTAKKKYTKIKYIFFRIGSAWRVAATIPKNWKYIVYAGTFGALSSLMLVYTSNPKRTPVIFQTIIPGLAIIPSAILTKIFLKKNVQYVKKYIIPSFLLQIISIVLSMIPAQSEWHTIAIISTLTYFIGTVLRCFQNICQEKYIICNMENTTRSKFEILFFGRLTQFVVTLLFSWVDYFVGYDDHIINNIGTSSIQYVTSYSHFLLFEGFIVGYVLLYVFSVYLNAISTNFNMITSTLTNPSVAIFFIIFPNLNNGISLPLYYSIPSILCSVLSVLLWIYGEHHLSKQNTKPEEEQKLIGEVNKIVDEETKNIATETKMND